MPDIVTTRIFTDGEKGITATKMNDIIGGSTVQTSFVGAKPVASSTVAGDQLLLLTAGGSYARIDSSVFSSSIAALLPAPEPKIWSVRLLSFNAVGNSTMECDQRNVGAGIVNAAGGAFIQDRWINGKSATLTVNVAQDPAPISSPIVVPGTNFRLTRNFLRYTLTGQQASLAASDFLIISQNVEGPNWRELSNDVHSISLLVRTSVAGLKFGVCLRDSPVTKSLVKLCTIPSANTWTLITLPNLPVWPAANFTDAPGSIGYIFAITLAAGTTLTAPANDTWQTGNFVGAVGQDNWASKPVNSTFHIAFVQHEPGAQCSTPMDCPFTQNLTACQRYYCKSYDYGTAIGNTAGAGTVTWFTTVNTQFGTGTVRFPQYMAKVPTVTIYNATSGVANNITGQDSAARGVSASSIGTGGFATINFGSVVSASTVLYHQGHYVADSGW